MSLFHLGWDGTWDGDGVDTAGVMRGRNWYLENESDSDGRATISFPYGRPGDRPVVGRWRPDHGHDRIGVVRGRTWLLSDRLVGGAADHRFDYGIRWDRKLTWGQSRTGTASPKIGQRIYRYYVGTEGSPDGGVDTFARAANLALTRGLGWSLDHEIRMIETGSRNAAHFRLWLTDDEDVGGKAPTCSDQWSCTVGNDVFINDDNWNNATATWDHRELRDYRMYVINHEVGHWLGLDHYNYGSSCRDVDGDGRGEAPVMMQQSIDLRGCATNTWPLPFERRIVRDIHLD